MPRRVNRRYRPAHVFKALPIDCRGTTRHFPGLGILAQIMKARLTAGATLAMQTRMFADLLERPFGLVDRECLRAAVKKKPVIRAG